MPATPSVLYTPERAEVGCAHEWSEPYDGWVHAEFGELIRQTWKVWCPRCGKVEERDRA